MRPEIVEPLRRITDAIHDEGAKASIQLGHCGNMSHRSTAGQIPISASTGFNLYSPTFVRGMRKDEIEEVAKAFGTAVNTARDAGFDAVESMPDTVISSANSCPRTPTGGVTNTEARSTTACDLCACAWKV